MALCHENVTARLLRPLVASSIAFSIALGACAQGAGDPSAAAGDSGTAGDDARTGEAGEGGEGGARTSVQKACGDWATQYCPMLEKCAGFAMHVTYGDGITCASRIAIACADVLSAPGTGWTGDGLEACKQAVAAFDCETFLHVKPAPVVCRVNGTIDNGQPCRYDAQCRTGYCRITSGSCGNCTALGLTGAPCSTYTDCDGDLMCASSGTCQPPSGKGATCDSTHPCKLGLACIGGTCAAPGQVGASCTPSLGGIDCDSQQGAYCDSTSKSCAALVVAQNGQPCDSRAACFGGGTCFGGNCQAVVSDGSPCNPQQGENCETPASCQQGLCQMTKASACQ